MVFFFSDVDCNFECPKGNLNDTYYYDPIKCNRFNRCHNGILYDMPCPSQTYFNTQTCACDHTTNILDVCNKKNERIKKFDKRDKCN